MPVDEWAKVLLNASHGIALPVAEVTAMAAAVAEQVEGIEKTVTMLRLAELGHLARTSTVEARLVLAEQKAARQEKRSA